MLSEAGNKNKEPEEVAEPTSAEPEPEPEINEARKPGRPKVRRSNLNYTKLCALIPMDMLLDVQSILIQKRRNKIKPRPKDMSALVRIYLLNRRKEKTRLINQVSSPTRPKREQAKVECHWHLALTGRI